MLQENSCSQKTFPYLDNTQIRLHGNKYLIAWRERDLVGGCVTGMFLPTVSFPDNLHAPSSTETVYTLLITMYKQHFFVQNIRK